jgi:phosphoribosylanthranilate isomerase
LDDLRALAAVREEGRGFDGVIVGRALYEGAFTVAQALEVLAAAGADRAGDAACG